MAQTHRSPLVRAEYPQYAYALAIFSGGLAFLAPQIGAPIASWLTYALLAMLFGSIWPYKASQWALWLCLPVMMLIFFDFMISGSINVLYYSGMFLAKTLASAFLGAYVGSRFPVHTLARRFEHIRTKGRMSSAASVTRNGLDFKSATTHVASVNTVTAVHNSQTNRPAIEPSGVFHNVDAALIEAAQKGDVDRIKILLADGADPNTESADEWMPSAIAALGSDVLLAGTLFGQGAALDYSGGRGWTPVVIATIEGHIEAVGALLAQGAQVDAEKSKGWTALRFAVSMDETEILRLLLDARADPNIPDQEGRTALMQAAAENIQNGVKLLLDAGADPHIRDQQDQTALMIARYRDHTEIIDLLTKAEASVSTDAKATVNVPRDDDSGATEKTHRIIQVRRELRHSLAERYHVVLRGAALPYGCEETGREGNEEDCRECVQASNFDEQPEPGWSLGFSR